jgi:multidrug resistance protein, MATE family
MAMYVELKPKGAGFGDIWRLSWPQILMMFVNFTIGACDVYVAGRLGREVQASVGMLAQAMFFFQVVAFAVANGAVAAVSQSLGAGKKVRAGRYVGLSLMAGGGMSLVILVGGFGMRGAFLAMLQVPPSMEQVAGYILDVFLLLLPINYLFIITNAVFRAEKRVKIPLVSWGVAAVLNAVGDFGLGLGFFGLPDMGYKGLAWSTFGSISGALVFNLFILRRLGSFRRAVMPPLRWIKRGLPYLFKVAWPSGLMQIIWHTGYLVLFSITASLPFESVTALAGMAAGIRVESLIFLPPMAFNFTASILVGHYLGAGQGDEAKRVGYKIWGVGVVAVTLMAAMMWPFVEQAVGIFTPDAAVRAEAALYLRYNLLAIPFTVTGMILIGALVGAGATLYNMAVTAVSIWCVRLPLAWWLGHVYYERAEGVWMAMLLSQMVQALAYLYIYQFKDWRRFGMGRAKTAA